MGTNEVKKMKQINDYVLIRNERRTTTDSGIVLNANQNGGIVYDSPIGDMVGRYVYYKNGYTFHDEGIEYIAIKLEDVVAVKV
jgi:co-chaperonin GroES (HSP10)